MDDNSFIKVAITDINGVMRSKYLAANKFEKVLKKGLPFCDVINGSDINDELVDKLAFTGWETGYPDKLLSIIPESKRHLPFEDNRALYLAEFSDKKDTLCPRAVLKTLCHKAEEENIFFTAGMEFEFTLFRETPDSALEKGYHHLKPATPGQCGYSMLRTSELHEFHQDLLNTCEIMDMPLEGLHTEIGPGVIEASLKKAPILEAGDRATLFKTVTKLVARKHGLMACFMAKWDKNQQGQSGHVHFSLQDASDKALFTHPTQEETPSPLMNNALAGLQAYAPELLLLSAPFVNSFARLVPGFWAPIQASVGFDNRTCAIRAILGNEASQRIEYRIPGADSTPYLAMSAIVIAVLQGIQDNKTSPLITEGNAYQQQLPSEYQLPANMPEAVAVFRQSDVAKAHLGSVFVEDYATIKEHEWKQAQAAITDWALKRYFELA
jgi:glutamine synthetase